MNIVRWISVVVLIPVYLILATIMAWPIVAIFGVWEYWIFPVTFPLTGMMCTYFLAPHHKLKVVFSIWLLGILIAYYFAYPVYFPEAHDRAYEETYVPFYMTVTISTLVLASLAYLVRR